MHAPMTGEGPNPSGMCMCGCGQPAPIARQSRTQLGYIKGKPVRFIQNHHTRSKAGPDYIERDCGYATPCWVWARAMCRTTGYGRVGGHGFAHRAYYERHKGLVPKGMELDHLCRNRACVNPDHLEAVTHAENMRRAKRVKLTAADVTEMRRRRAAGDQIQHIARDYGIDASHAGRVISGKRWRDAA